MSTVGLLDIIPLWLLFPLGFLLILACCDIGFRLGRNFAKGEIAGVKESAAITLGSVLGFLAFMLAFTFNTAANRFQERRDVLVQDANSISKSYLRSKLLAEPEGAELRALLRSYVDNRLAQIDLTNAADRVSQSEKLTAAMWDRAQTAAAKAPTPITATFVQALNEMIDVNTERITIVLYHRIPNWIWFSLFVLVVLGIGSLGYQNGLNSKVRSPTITAATLCFAIILLVTIALDRPGAGLFNVDQAAMESVKREMQHDEN
jgi:hypothetical protein